MSVIRDTVPLLRVSDAFPLIPMPEPNAQERDEIEAQIAYEQELEDSYEREHHAEIRGGYEMGGWLTPHASSGGWRSPMETIQWLRERHLIA